MLTQYNCFEGQNCVDDEEMDVILGQIQQIFENLKSKFINLLNDDDKTQQTNQVELQQQQLEMILLQLLHNQKS